MNVKSGGTPTEAVVSAVSRLGREGPLGRANIESRN
jgi:hypothetical protein